MTLKTIIDNNIPHKPILFNREMIEALKSDRKTQTRRTQGLDCVNVNPDLWTLDGVKIQDCWIFHHNIFKTEFWISSPFGKPGDLLWVREAFRFGAWHLSGDLSEVAFRADGNESLFANENGNQGRWKPSIHLPKRASRFWLRIKDVRIERIQSISIEDCKAEGIDSIEDYWGERGWKNYHPESGFKHDWFFEDAPYSFQGIRHHEGIEASFFSLIASMNGWPWLVKNPWVWAVEFEVLSAKGAPSLELLHSLNLIPA